MPPRRAIRVWLVSEELSSMEIRARKEKRNLCKCHVSEELSSMEIAIESGKRNSKRGVSEELSSMEINPTLQNSPVIFSCFRRT